MSEHAGDPRFGERRFRDSDSWEPSRLQPDSFLRPAATVADISIAEAERGLGGSISAAGVEPGPSEFSYGRGQMSPISLGPGPTQIEQLKAVQRTDPSDPGAVAEDRYADWIREAGD